MQENKITKNGFELCSKGEVYIILKHRGKLYSIGSMSMVELEDSKYKFEKMGYTFEIVSETRAKKAWEHMMREDKRRIHEQESINIKKRLDNIRERHFPNYNTCTLEDYEREEICKELEDLMRQLDGLSHEL